MSNLQALLLGLLQGFTEFFPVSSSAHLKILESFFEIPDSLAGFDLICHFGTVLALCLYLRKELFTFYFDKKNFLHISLAIFPLIPMYLFYSYLKELLSNLIILGPFLILTGIFLLKTKERAPLTKESPKRKIKDVLCIGGMQAMALIPGISRSGSTIFMGCKRGWSFEEARKFSFLLAIPTILGGCFLQGIKLSGSLQFPPSVYGIGFLSSLFFGYVGAHVFFSWIHAKNFHRFGFYCLGLGLFVILYTSWSYGLQTSA